MEWIVFSAIWAVLLVADIALGVKRASLAHQFDGSMHVLETDSVINMQVTEERSLERLGFWAKWMTLLVIVYGFGLAGFYCFHLWNGSLVVH